MEYKLRTQEDGTSSAGRQPSVRHIAPTETLIMTELEKRRMIREEIIMSGLRRRLELEAEMMRELLLEREIAMRRCQNSPLFDSSVSLLSTQFFNRQDGLGIGGRLRILGGSQSGFKDPYGGLLGDQIPFGRQTGVKDGVGIKPVIDLSKGKTISVNPVNPSVAGIKRKFETGFATGTDKSPSVSLGKKLHKDWSCPLCQVNSTSEKALNDHLKGKKHKAKEKALLRSNKLTDNSISNSNPVANESEHSIDHAMCSGSMNPESSNCPKEKEEEGVKKVQQAEDLRKINEGYPIGETTAMLKSTDFTFWCELCNFGTTSDALMTAHRMGKNHMAMLQENGGCVIAVRNMPDNVQHVENTKDSTSKEGKDETLDNTNTDIDGERADREDNVQQVEKTKDTTAKEGKDETVNNTDTGLDWESAEKEEKENWSSWQ